MTESKNIISVKGDKKWLADLQVPNILLLTYLSLYGLKTWSSASLRHGMRHTASLAIRHGEPLCVYMNDIKYQIQL